MKNTTTILIVLILAIGGYYMYAQNKNAGLSLEGGASLTEDMVTRTQIFIERRALLDTVKIDTAMFEDPVFRSYKSFSEPVLDEPIGRDNPFSIVSTKKVQN